MHDILQWMVYCVLWRPLLTATVGLSTTRQQQRNHTTGKGSA